ncbi:MAG TPA: iron-containing alcohol dehydrogenase family protein [Micromonosporaceae bacterium]|nr:iron-containing alcohol dehydrogenase family protein [Micromonosporaceae bacterium]
MPLLTRTVFTPLTIEISADAVRRLGALLADGRISAGGKVAVVLGPGMSAELSGTVAGALPSAELLTIAAGTFDSATALAERLRSQPYDAVVGIGGGKVIDTVKYAATQQGMPMVAVATSLAHDGIASPVSTLDRHGVPISYGVHVPIAVVVDLTLVARSPLGQIQSGIGDALSNLSACADWELSHRCTGEPVDGLALALARSGAQAVLNHPGSATDPDFLTALAEALILGGISMAVAGSSRPCSGACHEITHALGGMYPWAASHGLGAGLGALFATYLRARYSSDDGSPDSGDNGHTTTFTRLGAVLERHGLPRVPSDIGLTAEQFAAVVEHAPATRPGRYTILEHLDLEPTAVRTAVEEYVDAIG